MKKPAQNGSATKLLMAAREEFAIHGLEGARVDRIAARAQINKAMIYYHFHSKDNLYRAVIDDHFTQIGDLEIFLQRMAAFFHKMFQERQNFIPILLRELASGGDRIKAPITRIISVRGLNWKIKEMIDRGREKGEFRNLDSTHAIISFVGMNLAYLMMAPIMNSIWEIKDEGKFKEKRQKEVVNLFLHGLKAK
ncbi:MAG: TetR/AcrR family transcriptional regulator [candidate division Zixibacteria bacterium]|nr:TetR/AcrR family transcriptional regulator [candidate division Zixibacteria bacterium]